MYNQISKNFDEYLSSAASLIQQSSSNVNTLNQPSQQTIHLIQTFNSTINSLVKHINPQLTTNPTSNFASNHTVLNTNSEMSKLDEKQLELQELI